VSGDVADAKALFWLAGGALVGLASWVGWVLATAETRKGPLVRAVRDERSADADGGPDESARSPTPDAERAAQTAAESAEGAGEGTGGDGDPRG
jgi:hypothetical protein